MRADPALTWYGLAVTTGREIAVKKDLKNTGLNILIPISTAWHRVSWRCRKLELSARPVLQGYVFAGCSGQFPFDDLAATKLYCKPVKIPGSHELSTIPHWQINRVIDLAIKLDLMVPPRNGPPAFKAGMAVQFAASDPFAGERARITQVLKDELVEIEHRFLGSVRRSQVKTARLEIVAKETLASNTKQA
jgi:transcription antitermination factor NusG